MYQEQENFNWFSQNLLTHKDKFYGTDGYLRISIGTGTGDFRNFNSPSFGIAISNQFNKSYNLTYSNAIDLLQTLKEVKSQTNSNNSEIQRKYKKDLTLYIRLFVESNNNDSVVEIRIITSETDFTKVIIPISVFSIFAKCLKHYIDSYFNICSNLLVQSISTESRDIIQQLPHLIKGVSSQIITTEHVPQNTISDNSEANTISESGAPKEEAVQATQASIEDLDKFLGDNLENITLDEVEEKVEKKEPVLEIDSPFTEKVIKNDLSNLENMLNNHSLNDNPIITFSNEIKIPLDPYTSEDFHPLKEIKEDDLKSLSYLSKLFYRIAYQSYLDKNVPFPSAMPTFRFDVKKNYYDNENIAFDLLLFSLFIKLVRGRLQNKITDQIKNNSLFYIQLRCLTDPLIYSYIKDTNELKSVIINRYRYYSEIGVFDKYLKNLEDTGCSEIQEQEIESLVSDVIDKIINKSLTIDKLHEAMIPKNKLRLPTKNDFSLEQITNELIPMEVHEKMGVDVLDETFLENINKQIPISEKVIDLFNHEVKVKKESKVKQKFKNNLERIVNYYSSDVPKQHQDSFKDFIRNNDNKAIDLKTIGFPLDEFGDDVVKALYLWKPESEPELTKSYKKFQLAIENEIMDKKLILAALNDEANVSEDGWDGIFG